MIVVHVLTAALVLLIFVCLLKAAQVWIEEEFKGRRR